MSAAADPYSAEVRRLFREPRHAGRLEPAATARREGQGASVELSMRCTGPAIAELRFRAFGCPHLIAACEAFCRDWEGRPVAALASFSAEGLLEALPVPIEKTGRILVLEDAVRSLARLGH